MIYKRATSARVREFEGAGAKHECQIRTCATLIQTKFPESVWMTKYDKGNWSRPKRPLTILSTATSFPGDEIKQAREASETIHAMPSVKEA